MTCVFLITIQSDISKEEEETDLEEEKEETMPRDLDPVKEVHDIA